ncbi:MAG: hypothetical protein ACO376_00740 [Gammaproteobacteria bacterium]
MDIGAWDWISADLADALYPPDLPEEWRVGLYSGSFRCVALPAELWRAAGAEGWATWLDEVPENFGFYLEQGNATAEELTQVAQALGPLLHGVLLTAESSESSGVVDATESDALAELPDTSKLWPAALSDNNPLAQVGARVWLPRTFSAPAVIPSAEFQYEIVDNAQSLPHSGAVGLQGYACLGLCRLPVLDGQIEWTPLRLRQMLEAATAQRVCAMVVTPGRESLAVMRQLETLSGLMGV